MCAEAEGDVCYEDGNICLDTSKTKRKSSGFLERLKTEEIFRHRIIHTFVIYWSFITVVSSENRRIIGMPTDTSYETICFKSCLVLFCSYVFLSF